MERVVVPDAKTLPISRGDWLLVRARLNAGENRQMIRRGTTVTDGGLRVDTLDAALAKILAYLLDWSIKGPDGTVIQIRDKPPALLEGAVLALEPESYTEILRAIEDHEAAMQAARDAEKNAQGGEGASSVTSPSPSVAAGATSGSLS